MKCVEYIYNERQANELKETLEKEEYDGVELIKTIDEDANEDVWVVSWNPKPMK